MDLLHAAQVCTHASVLYMFQYISFAFNCNVCRRSIHKAAPIVKAAAVHPPCKLSTSKQRQLQMVLQPSHCQPILGHHHLHAQCTLNQLPPQCHHQLHPQCSPHHPNQLPPPASLHQLHPQSCLRPQCTLHQLTPHSQPPMRQTSQRCQPPMRQSRHMRHHHLSRQPSWRFQTCCPFLHCCHWRQSLQAQMTQPLNTQMTLQMTQPLNTQMTQMRQPLNTQVPQMRQLTQLTSESYRVLHTYPSIHFRLQF